MRWKVAEIVGPFGGILYEGPWLEHVQVVLTSSVLHNDIVYTAVLEELRAGMVSYCFRDSFTDVCNR